MGQGAHLRSCTRKNTRETLNRIGKLPHLKTAVKQLRPDWKEFWAKVRENNRDFVRRSILSIVKAFFINLKNTWLDNMNRPR